jgi:hypothetical protein
MKEQLHTMIMGPPGNVKHCHRCGKVLDNPEDPKSRGIDGDCVECVELHNDIVKQYPYNGTGSQREYTDFVHDEFMRRKTGTDG